MRRVLVGLALGVELAACGLDETGTTSDGGLPDVTVDVSADVIGLDASDAADVADVVIQDVFLAGCDAGTTCIANIPGAYKIVEYDPSSQTPCDKDYNAPTNLVTNPQPGPNNCACSCTNPNPLPTCSCGGSTAAFDIANGQNGCSPNGELLADLNCYNNSQSLSGNTNMIAAKPDAGCTASGGTCAAASAKGNVNVDQQAGRRCDLNTPNTPACSGNGICVPTPSGGSGLCITDNTMNNCPPTWTNFQHIVGQNVINNLACACTGNCTVTDAGSCATPKLTVYDNANCTGSSNTLIADGTCSGGIGSGPWLSAKYSSTNSNAACGFSGSPSVTGSVTLQNPYRICCQ
jgi:hypothetical protein